MSTAKLVLTFGTMSGEKTFRFAQVKDNATTASVKALANTMIANGSIYQYPPLTISSAKMVVTSETPYDLSD